MSIVDTDAIEIRGEFIIVSKGLRSKDVPVKLWETYCDDIIKLDLSNNKLDTLPDTVAVLSCLKTLDVKRNSLVKLCDSLSQCTELEEVILSRNYITTLPQYFNSFVCLRTLNLSSNSLKTFPDTLSGLKSLVQLDLSNCELTSLPLCVCTIASLKDLRLVQNNMKTLPDQIRMLKQLVRCDLSQCALLEVLPAGVGAINTLTTLELSGCTALTVPPKHIVSAGMTKIKEFLKDMDRSCVPELSVAVGTGLTEAATAAPSTFTIVAKLATGDNKISGGDAFVVVVKPADSAYKCVDGIVTDKNNGSYDVCYTVPWCGPAKISVLCNNIHIKGSPFSIVVKGVEVPARSNEQIRAENIKNVENMRVERIKSAEEIRNDRIRLIAQDRQARVAMAELLREERIKAIEELRLSRVRLAEEQRLGRIAASEQDRLRRVQQADAERLRRIENIEAARLQRIADRVAKQTKPASAEKPVPVLVKPVEQPVVKPVEQPKPLTPQVVVEQQHDEPKPAARRRFSQAVKQEQEPAEPPLGRRFSVTDSGNKRLSATVATLTTPPTPIHRRRPSVEIMDDKGYVAKVVQQVEDWQKANTETPTPPRKK